MKNRYLDKIWSDYSLLYNKVDKTIHYCNVHGAERGLILSEIHKHNRRTKIVIAPDAHTVKRIIDDIVFFNRSKELVCTYFPPYNLLPFKSLSYHHETASERLRILYEISTGKLPDYLILTPETLMQRLIPKSVLSNYTDIIMENEEIDINALITKFVSGGYTRTALVEEPGDFSIRGGIVDFFSPVYSDPVRVELFGDMVESIRFFSVNTQRKTDHLTEAIIIPAKEAVIESDNLDLIVNRVRKLAANSEIPVSKIRDIVDRIKGEQGASEFESLLPLVYTGLDTVFDYFPSDLDMVVIEPQEIRKNFDLIVEKYQNNYKQTISSGKLALPHEELYLDWEDVQTNFVRRNTIVFQELSVVTSGYDTTESTGTVHYKIESNNAIRTQLNSIYKSESLLEPLVDWIQDKKENVFLTILVCRTKSQAHRLQQLLGPYGIEPDIIEGVPDLNRPIGQVVISVGHLSSGFVWGDLRLALITEDEIFGDKKRVHRTAKRKKGKDLLAFNELKEGDYVVHSEHGIGKYAGLEKIIFNGISNDFLLILYKEDDRLYLPVDRMGMLQKYIGMDGYTPALDKMGGKSWDKIKEKAKKEVEKMAGELLKLYAERKVHTGYAFSPPDSYFRDFEAGFPYEETQDQLSAIEDVISDMEAQVSMDRLVCGDVGYGKTEVALRAAFKAINDGKQVAVLVPTTVLAEQHSKTFSERFGRYPVNVKGLSRFRTKKEQKLIVEGLKSGTVDVVIGTHRLLSKDIAFKDLGLIVVDEEQRFGVKHKESLKKLRSTVDVLTLTATPIPRTLHMSMTGIRDISIISTPPEERQAIVSYISEFDDLIIKEGIQKELDRNGQIFFIHNTIKTIEKVNDHLNSLVPEVRTGVAHGQMNESDLEVVMMKFINREIDMLVCTTIVESGLDIPAANTMFINRADKFGLSQMYQLRGRIGRSDEQAYAYLFIPDESMITKDARKRLRVLMEHSDLGAGFQIAMSDLQIRGGGAALGASQSGHIAAVGYEMFLQLMEDAINDLKGEPKTETLDPEINVNLSAYFPEEYIPEIDQRLMLYRRLSGLKKLKELTDIKEEISERYGRMPVEAKNILLKIMLKVLAIQSGVKRLDISGTQAIVYFSPVHQKNPHGIVDLIMPEPERFELTPDNILKAKLSKGRSNIQVAETRKLLKDIAQHVNG